jgi:nucleotidyltransferase/DNA polymerase involved in DNA repair
MRFIRDLPCRKINGIGKVFERVLSDALDIRKVADIYEKRAVLYKLLSEKSFDFLINVYLGLGSTTIRPAEDYERKSVGTERTFRDEHDEGKLREILKGLAEDLEGDLERANTAVYIHSFANFADCQGRCINIKVILLYTSGFTNNCSTNYIPTKSSDLPARANRRSLRDKRC